MAESNRGQKGKPNAETTKNVISKEELDLATSPTKRQNAKQ